MSNLVQKTITDKNGVITSRWVKPESGESVGKSIPAPTGSKSQKPAPTPRLDTIFDRGPLRNTLITLESFDPRAVQAVEALLEKSAETPGPLYGYTDRTVFSALKDVYDIMFTPNFDDDDTDDEAALAPFHNLAVFGDVVLTPETLSAQEDMLVRGLNQFPITDYLTEATEEEVRAARALVTVAARIDEPFIINNWGEPEDDSDFYHDEDSAHSTYITSKELSDFIISRPDDALEIAKIIMDRKSDDVELIRTVLDHEQKALSEGML